MSVFQPASRQTRFVRLLETGPAKAGKTMTALKIAKGLSPIDGKVAVIDTEYDSSTLYDYFGFDVLSFHKVYKKGNEPDFHPLNFVKAINEAITAGYPKIIIDSLSHHWMGPGGALQLQSEVAKRTGNSFTAWYEINPFLDKLTTTILSAPAHIICTARSKIEYSIQEDGGSKKKVVSLGLQPQLRESMLYEFDIIAQLLDGVAYFTNSRCQELQGKQFTHGGVEIAEILTNWLNDPRSEILTKFKEARAAAKKLGIPIPDLTQQIVNRMSDGDIETETQRLLSLAATQGTEKADEETEVQHA